MWFWHRHSDLFGVKQVLDPHPPSAFIVSVLHDSPPYYWYSKVLVVVPAPAHLIQAQLTKARTLRNSRWVTQVHMSHCGRSRDINSKGSELTVSVAAGATAYRQAQGGPWEFAIRRPSAREL